MGFPMAGHLAGQGPRGHGLQPHARPRRQQWCERLRRRGRPPRPREAAAGGRDRLRLRRQRRRPALGRPTARTASWPAWREGAILVDHTTASADVARELFAACRRAGRALHRRAGLGRAGRGRERRAHDHVRRRAGRVRPRRAGAARLWAGGDPDGPGRRRASSPRWSTRSASPAWCRRWPRAINFAQRAGLDPDQVLATISKGAAQSWQMENRWPTMAAGKFDFGFAVDWMRKDLAIALDEGAAQRRGPAGHGAGRPVLPAGPAAAAAAASTPRA